MKDENSSQPLSAGDETAGTATFVYYGYDWELVINNCSTHYYPPPVSSLPQPGQIGDVICVGCISYPEKSSGEALDAAGARAGGNDGSRGEYPAIRRMNLIYHVYPNRANDVWLRNVHQLRQRLGLFNGRKIVAIALGPDLEHPDQVRAAVDWPDVEYLLVPNDPEIGHAASFSRLLQSVRSKDPSEATFYAHTKGAANGRQDARAIEFWRNAMYASLLDDPGRVRGALQRFAAVGCCKRVHPGSMAFPSGLPWGRWHFAGTFFWFRHDRVFSDYRWPFVPHDYFGVESWLGGFVAPEEAISLLQPRAENDRTWTPYDRTLWVHPIADHLPAAGNGKSEEKQEKHRISVVIPCKGRLAQLCQTLPYWLRQETPPHEIIVVDFGCPEGCGDWVARTYPGVRVVRAVNGIEFYNGARARNVGAVEATGNYLAFADADFVAPPDYLERVQRQLRAGHDLVCIAHYDSGELGLNGICTVSAALYRAIRGYDESQPTYGYDDTDFYRRCESAGASMGYLHNCQCMSHSDDERMRFYPDRDKAEAMRKSAVWMADTSRLVNPEGFGQP